MSLKVSGRDPVASRDNDTLSNKTLGGRRLNGSTVDPTCNLLREQVARRSLPRFYVGIAVQGSRGTATGGETKTRTESPAIFYAPSNCFVHVKPYLFRANVVSIHPPLANR